jgi:hypothetical protein
VPLVGTRRSSLIIYRSILTMLSFSPLLGINSSKLGMGHKSIVPSRIPLGKEHRLFREGMKTIDPLPLHSPLIQTSKLLSFTPEPNAIGWDNWTPIDSTLNSSLDIDAFDSIVNRSTLEISTEFDRIDSDFATTIFTSELEQSSYIDDSLSTIDSRNERLRQQDDLAIPIIAKKGRSKSQAKSNPQSSSKKKPTSAKTTPNKERNISPKSQAKETSTISPSLTPNQQSIDVSIPDNLSSPSTLINPSILPSNSSPSVEATPISTEGVGIGETMDGLITDNSPSPSTIINPSPSVEATPIPTEGVGIGETLDGLITDNSPSPSTIINPSPSIEVTPIQTEGMGIGETIDRLIADNSPSASTIINPAASVETTAILGEGLGIGEAMDGWISDNIALNQYSTLTSTNDSIANLPETDLNIAVDKSTEINHGLDSIASNSETKLNSAEAESSVITEGELPLFPIDGEEASSPTLVKGYATGGHVLEPDRVDRKPIAPSDIIPAMLTPGEFVINAKDAQSNLDLLTHINSGGKLDRSILPESKLNQSSSDNRIDRKTCHQI